MAIVGSLMQIAFWTIVLPTAIWILIKLVGELFYGIGVMLFNVMDLLQGTFRKLAGLGTVYVDDPSFFGSGNGNGDSGDIVSLVLTSDAIIDVLIAVAIFSLGLLIVGSIVQVVRLEYTTNGSKNSKEKIFTDALKSLLMMALVPIVSLVGIRLSNYLLQAVDYATSGSGATTVSGSIFKAACASASKVLDDSNATNGVDLGNIVGSLLNGKDFANAVVESDGSKTYIVNFENVFFVSGGSSGQQSNYWDGLLNESGSDNPQISLGGSSQSVTLAGEETTTGNAQARYRLATKVDEAFTRAEENDGIFTIGTSITKSNTKGTNIKASRLSYTKVSAVAYFYNVSNVNYLILYLGCYICIKNLFNAALGMITRIYKLAALFIISPAVIGLQPIKDSFSSWKSKFIENVLSCYGFIVALNLYFSIVGVLSRISLWDSWAMHTPNLFVQFLFVLTGATMIDKLSGDIGGLIGGGNAVSEGSSVSGQIGQMAQGAAKVAGAGINMAGGIAGKVGQFAERHKGKDGFVRKTKGKDGKEHFSLKETWKARKDIVKDMKENSLAAQEKKAKKEQKIIDDYEDKKNKYNDKKKAFDAKYKGYTYDENTGDLKDASGALVTDAAAIEEYTNAHGDMMNAKNARDGAKREATNAKNRKNTIDKRLRNDKFYAEQSAKSAGLGAVASMRFNRTKAFAKDNELTKMFTGIAGGSAVKDALLGGAYKGTDEAFIEEQVKALQAQGYSEEDARSLLSASGVGNFVGKSGLGNGVNAAAAGVQGTSPGGKLANNASVYTNYITNDELRKHNDAMLAEMKAGVEGRKKELDGMEAEHKNINGSYVKFDSTALDDLAQTLAGYVDGTLSRSDLRSKMTHFKHNIDPNGQYADNDYAKNMFEQLKEIYRDGMGQSDDMLRRMLSTSTLNVDARNVNGIDTKLNDSYNGSADERFAYQQMNKNYQEHQTAYNSAEDVVKKGRSKGKTEAQIQTDLAKYEQSIEDAMKKANEELLRKLQHIKMELKEDSKFKFDDKPIQNYLSRLLKAQEEATRKTMDENKLEAIIKKIRSSEEKKGGK